MPNPWERKWEESAPWKREWTEPRPTPGMGESLGRGLGQGLSLGFQDELAGLLASPKGAYLQTKKLFGGEVDSNDEDLRSYLSARNEQRAQNEAAKRAAPGFYYPAEAVGTIATSFIPGVGITRGLSQMGRLGKIGGLIESAGLGGVLGAGQSDAETSGEMAQNMVRGAGGGLLGAGASKAVSKVGNALANPVVGALTDLASFGSPSGRLMLKSAKGLDWVNRKVGEGTHVLPGLGGLIGSKQEKKAEPSRVPQSVDEAEDREISSRLEEMFPRVVSDDEEMGEQTDMDMELLAQKQGFYNHLNDPRTTPEMAQAYKDRIAEIDKVLSGKTKFDPEVEDFVGDDDEISFDGPNQVMSDPDLLNEEGDTSEYEAWKKHALKNPPQLVLPKYDKKPKKGLIKKGKK